MKKQKTIENILIVCIIIGMFMSTSCRSFSPIWSLVWSGSNAVWRIYAAHEQINILVGVYSENQEIYYLEFTDTGTVVAKLEFESDQQPHEACLTSSNAWVVLVNGKVLLVDLESKTTQRVSGLQTFGHAIGCFVAHNESIYVYGHNWMATMANGSWISSKLPEDLPQGNITDDGEHIWVLYASGKLYQLMETEWILAGTLNTKIPGYPFELEVVGNTAWIATFDSLYKWNFSQENQGTELVVNFDKDNRNGLIALEQDSEGGIWLMTYKKVWHGVKDTFEEIDLPKDIPGIRAAALAKNWHRLYVASEEGIYCLNTSDMQTTCFMTPK